MARPQTRKRQRVDDPLPDQVPSKKPKSTGRLARPPKQQNRTSRADDPSHNQVPTASAKPTGVFPEPLRAKRQADNSPQAHIPSKKPRSSSAADTRSNFHPEFYHNLSKVWLTRRALQEFDRQTDNRALLKPTARPRLPRDSKVAALARRFGPNLASSAAAGGEDLSDLRGVCLYYSIINRCWANQPI